MSRVRCAAVVLLAGTFSLFEGTQAAPTVFPDGVTILTERVAEGHVLFRAQDRRVYLIENDGTVVHTWEFPCGAGGALTTTDNGGIIARSCEGLVEVDWDGNVVWEFKEPEGVTFHHDWARLPDGNTLILARKTVTAPELSDRDMLDDHLLEVTPSGDVVWEWHTVDHFEQFEFSDERVAIVEEFGGDWSHANTVAPIPEGTAHSDPRFRAGNIILSYRHTNTMIVIDRRTSDIVWVLTDATIGQHHTHMIPPGMPGAGNILIFDNGWAGRWTVIPNQYQSRVLEVEPETQQVVFSYRDVDSTNPPGTFFSFAIAGAQRLPNGNTMIAEGRHGRIFEIGPDKQIVWEYLVPIYNSGNSNHVYRATRLPLDWAARYFIHDLAVTWSNPTRGQDGGLVYEAVVSNFGAQPAVDTEVQFVIPPSATYRGHSASPGWDCTTPEPGATGTVRCNTRSLGANGSAVFTLGVNLETCRQAVIMTATASGVGDDADPANNSTSIETPRALCNRTRATR